MKRFFFKPQTSQLLNFSTSQLLNFSTSQLLKFSNFQIFKFSNSQILKFSNSQILKFRHSEQSEESRSLNVPKDWILRSAQNDGSELELIILVNLEE